MDTKKKESIDKLLNPKSVAVIGASERLSGYGGRMLNTLLRNNFPGKLYPVNPSHKELMGLPCYPSVRGIGSPVDLGIIIVKAGMVEDAVKECEACGVGALLIITAGLSEVDKKNGLVIERHIRDIARRADMRIVGPNCLGFANVAADLWACSTPPGGDTLKSGHIGIISQSGAAGFGPLLTTAKDRAVGLKYIVTTGNEADLSICDLAEYMLEDSDVRVLAWLIEGIRDGEWFKRILERARQMKKRMVMLKLGESTVGSRAAASHTAAMTGDMAIFNALIKQYGVVKADSYEELIEIADILQNDRQISGKRFAVISHSGGISGFGGDQFGKYGFDVPELCNATQTKIDTYLKGFGSPRNPVDLTRQMRTPNIVDIMTIIEKNDAVDAFVVATHGVAGTPEEGLLNVLRAAAGVSKPVYYVWTGGLCHEGLNVIKNSEMPVSFCLHKLASNMQKVYEARHDDHEEKPVTGAFRADVQRGVYLNEAEAKKLIALAGVRSPSGYIVRTKADIAALPGDAAVVMKVLSDTIIHKSDVGGVKLNLKGREQLEEAFSELRNIPGKVDGALVETMCEDGLDMIVGLRKDEQFGPILVVGLGGIYTELFKMISLRVLPLGRREIEKALDELPGLNALLSGYRGHSGYDRNALVDAITHLSAFFYENSDALDLVEINPLRVMPGTGGLYALDCVIKAS